MAGTATSELASAPSVAYQRRTVRKQVLDLAIGIPLCVIGLLIVLPCAIVLAAQLRGWPFFVHDRIGHGGRLISVPKLRTLPLSTEPYADKTATRLQPISPFAGFLRRTHLDELPQLLLVPIGRLSLVGPRPRMPAEAMECGDPHFAAVRTSVAQGCTGLWQISSAQSRRVSDGPEYDHFYVANHSLRLDLWILWRTVLLFLGGRTVELEDVPRWALPPMPQVSYETP